MSLKVLDYLYVTDEYLCEKYYRDKGAEEICIPFSKVGCYVDKNDMIGISSDDDKYYFLNKIPDDIVSIIVDGKFENLYKVEVSYADGNIKHRYLTARDFGEDVCEGDYLEVHYDNKFYVDYKSTYDASKRIKNKFDLLKKRSQENKQ